jgi:alpha-L-fucosidase
MTNLKSTPKNPEPDMSTLWGGKAGADGNHPRAAWFRESKYAMFIHWGLYSEAAGNWRGKRWHGISEWLMKRARIPVKEYEALAARFNPTGFDAEAWAKLAKAAGMRYLVLTSKHHEGFAMFKSKASPFNIVDACPWRRDPIAELAAACRKHGLGLGFYYSQFLDWHEADAAGNDWDFGGERTFDRYLHGKALPQITELLTNYGEVALIWFDTPGTISREACESLRALIRKLQPKCLINSRIGNGLGDYSSLGDQEVPVTGPEGLWETVDTHNDTWAYSEHDHHWKGPKELLSRLVRVVSLGGNYMLNVGPTGKGVIPEASAEILRRAGSWLKRNGAAVYGTGRSPIPAQAWGVCTMAPGKLFLHVLRWPTGGILQVPGIKGTVTRATVLSTGKKLAVTRRKGLLTVAVPELPPDSPITVLVLEMKGQMKAEAAAFSVYPNLPNEFQATFAKLSGCAHTKRGWMEKFGDWHHAEVVHQLAAGSEIQWRFEALAAGLFNVFLEYDCLPEGDASELELSVGKTRFAFPVFATGDRHEKRYRFRLECLGVVAFDKPGAQRLLLKALDIKGSDALSIARVLLEPVE